MSLVTLWNLQNYFRSQHLQQKQQTEAKPKLKQQKTKFGLESKTKSKATITNTRCCVKNCNQIGNDGEPYEKVGTEKSSIWTRSNTGDGRVRE
mmetsp:Transcript_6436/g.10142  ORF Transcript_6436/g.10142 Transcript_6436/m.10142 type:complete len:93 (+) Transcript_6436:7-285(+)